MESQTMPPDEFSQVCGVDGEYYVTQNGSLWHTILQLMGAQMYISWCELFECGQLNKIGTRPKHFLGCQMTIPVCEISSGGQLYQMQHWDQGEPVLPLHECRWPVGVHSEHITGPSQCYAVGDMLIDILHTDRLFSDGRQAAHIQCAL